MITKKPGAIVYDADGSRTSTELYGLSTDAKPEHAENADIFYEMDTKKVFMYDEDGAQWLEQ